MHNFLNAPKRQKLTCVICLEIDMKNMGLLPPSPSKCRDFYLLNFNVQLFSTFIIYDNWLYLFDFWHSKTSVLYWQILHWEEGMYGLFEFWKVLTSWILNVTLHENFKNFFIFLTMFGAFTSSFCFQSLRIHLQGTLNVLTGLRLAAKTISPKQNLLSLKLEWICNLCN